MVMSFYRTMKIGTLRKRHEPSLDLPETKPTDITASIDSDMVSRRKILSRSRDDLNTGSFIQNEEDVWYQKDKLYREHIQEVLDKWTQIDDEIWAKIIVFERNRRVAKAYARVPVLTVNGSNDGFDGMRIGLNGFDNPMRDQKVIEFKQLIGQGLKLKMDDNGNILARRYSKSNIYIRGTTNFMVDGNAIGNEILNSSDHSLEIEKVMKVFDMKKFQSNLNQELSRSYPDHRYLEHQCLSAIVFVKSENDILDCPIWVLIVNVVAMDMLKSRLLPVQRSFDIRNRPRIPVPDEDPYSIAAEMDSGSSGFGISAIYGHPSREQKFAQSKYSILRRSEKPPKLPPRDLYGHLSVPSVMKPDYDEIDDEAHIKVISRKKANQKYDDPYYCGLRARVPNFAKERDRARKTSQAKEEIYVSNSSRKLSHLPHDKIMKRSSIAHMEPTFSSLYQLNQINDPSSSLYQRLHHHSYHNAVQPPTHRPCLWSARSYESGIDSEFFESPYHIYGRLPTPSSKCSRGYIAQNSRMYVGDWE